MSMIAGVGLATAASEQSEPAKSTTPAAAEQKTPPAKQEWKKLRAKIAPLEAEAQQQALQKLAQNTRVKDAKISKKSGFSLSYDPQIEQQQLIELLGSAGITVQSMDVRMALKGLNNPEDVVKLKQAFSNMEGCKLLSLSEKTGFAYWQIDPAKCSRQNLLQVITQSGFAVR